jgi:glycosyltransferase involved in cell wall biosynthesis
MPGALLEAMCAGLPIVTTPVDGSAELIKGGEHGLYVPTSNPDALGSAIQRLLSDDELAAQLGHSAKERAIAEYSVEAMVETVEGLYDKMTS